MEFEDDALDWAFGYTINLDIDNIGTESQIDNIGDSYPPVKEEESSWYSFGREPVYEDSLLNELSDGNGPRG